MADTEHVYITPDHRSLPVGWTFRKLGDGRIASMRIEIRRIFHFERFSDDLPASILVKLEGPGGSGTIHRWTIEKEWKDKDPEIIGKGVVIGSLFECCTKLDQISPGFVLKARQGDV